MSVYLLLQHVYTSAGYLKMTHCCRNM